MFNISLYWPLKCAFNLTSLKNDCISKESFRLFVLNVGMILRFLFKNLKVSLVNVLLLNLTLDPIGSDLNLAVL